MQERYAGRLTSRVWDPDHVLARWLQIQYVNAKVRGADRDVVRAIRHVEPPTRLEIDAVEEQFGGHEMVAFLTLVEQRLAGVPSGQEAQCWLHRGMTTSDVTDSATSMLLAISGQSILQSARRLADALAGLRGRTAILRSPFGTDALYRTHGQPAVKMSLTDVATGMGNGYGQAITRLVAVPYYVRSAGPSGINPVRIADALSLTSGILLLDDPAAYGHQALNRAYWVEWADAVSGLVSEAAQTASWMWDRLAFREAEMGGSTSSSMPHKSNPVALERIWGLARVVRGLRNTLAESTVHRSDRDISSSSVERVVLPQIANYAEFLLDSLTDSVIRFDFDPVACLTALDVDDDLTSFNRLQGYLAEGFSYTEARRQVGKDLTATN